MLLRQRQEPTIRGWLNAFPDEVVRVRPVLAIGFVGALMSLGEFDGVDARLRDVERLLERNRADRPEMVVVDEDEFRRLPAETQMYRAALALVRGDTSATLRHASLAIDRAATDDHLTLAGASALSGLAHWGSGDLEAAHRAYSVSILGLRRTGNLSDVLGCSITLADIRMVQGRLGDALRTYEQALQFAADHGRSALRGLADMYVGMGLVAFERNDVDGAAGLLRRSQELGEAAGLPQNRYRWRVATAHVAAAQGDLSSAFQLLAEAERLYVGDFLPNVRPVPALTARLLAAQGRVTEALGWTKDMGLSVDDDLSYLREFEHVTLARVLLAQYAAHRTTASGNEVARLLERLLSAAEAGARMAVVIEVLVLQALTRQAGGDAPGALMPLVRALRLAEPEGYARVFLSEGPPMVALLAAVAKKSVSWTYVNRLVDANGGRQALPGRVAQNLVDPLSARELVVLRLLGSDLSGPAIARELVVSLNTLRTHTRNIYAKLGVNSRREAVRQAVALNVLSP
jgi:LuxR family maltose regulon positive regulatory protein